MNTNKAPDKIYVSNLIYDSWQYTIPDPDDETEVEYIRKDALIEWIREVRAIPHDNGIARDLAFQEIVNKINSM